MIKRQYCQVCHKPLRVCICHLFCHIENTVKIVVLQHQQEVNHPKGSLPLLANSLSCCEVLIGEDFTQHARLNEILANKDNICCVLYPEQNALSVDEICSENKSISHLIIIDATWRKAFKIMQLSKNLEPIPKLSINIDKSLYAIRKTQKHGALSTLEACCYALSALESSDQYQILLKNFIRFNQMHQIFRESLCTNHR